MVLYYTTSVSEGDPQSEPSTSLGGFRSGTLIKNDDFSNLFGEISPYTVRENRDEYIALMLRNETGAEVTNAEIWVTTPDDNYSDLQLAVVTAPDNAAGIPQIERVGSRFIRPTIGDFSATDTDNRITIGTIPINGQFGVWVKRILNLTNITEDQNNIYELDPENPNLYRSVELSQSDSFGLNLEWM